MADSRAICQPESFKGLPCWRLSLPQGDRLRIAEHGAHVLSWVSGGREHLFLSEASRFNGRDAIRGGIPVCWPQFNARGSLPKHGFARNLPWSVHGQPELAPDRAEISLQLVSGPLTRDFWAQEFEARVTVTLTPGSLRVTLGVHNTDLRPLDFTGALHTYLAVEDVAQAQLSGLGGQSEWDALADRHGVAADVLRFPGAFDRVYRATPAPLALREGARRLVISQSPQWSNTVVWTPGQALSASMADMDSNAHSRLLCVEAAQVFEPITVLPQQQWQGWQQFNVL